MAKKIDEVKNLTIDGVQYDVDTLSKEVQSMVDLFNSWSQREADIIEDLQVIKAAKNDLSRQIIVQVQKDQQEAEDETVVADEPVDPVAE